VRRIAIAVGVICIASAMGAGEVQAAQAKRSAAQGGRASLAALELATTRPVAYWSGYSRPGGSATVRAVQRHLRASGYSPGPLDGLFGPLTERATRRFQRASHLAVDGIVGPRTVKALSRRAVPNNTGSSPAADSGKAPERTTRRGTPAGGQPDVERAEAPSSSAHTGRQKTPVAGATSEQGTGADWVDGVLIALAAAGILVLGLGVLMAGRSRGRRRGRSLVRVSPDFVADGHRPGLGHFSGRLLAMSLGVSWRGRKSTRYLVADARRRTAFWVEQEELRGIEFAPGSEEPARALAQAMESVQPSQLGSTELPTPGPDGPMGDSARPVALGYVTSANGTTRVGDPDLRAQTEQLEQLCRQRGWTLAKVVREVNSNGSGERPALDYALERLRGGEVSCLVVGRLGQLCRSVGEVGAIIDQLNEIGAGLVSLEPELDTTTDIGAAAAQSLVAVSAWEREQHALRTRKGLAAARASSVTTRPAVQDRPDLKERILALRAGGMTLQAIADTLNAEGIPTLRGGSQWRPSSVQAAVGYKRPTRGSLSQKEGAAQNGIRT
jgi:DNA invertase Pin-like site-specific DNA recombinase